MDRILTVADVAEILQVKPITVREMFREKRLRAFKMGKGWRTTEAMLQEDIQTLAQGAGVGMQGANPTQEASVSRSGKPKRKPRPAADKKSVEAPKKRKVEADDAQQLLF